VLVPPLSLVLAFALGVSALVVARTVERRRVACSSCGEQIRPGALVCIHCGADQNDTGG
jgi:ribosomal protein L32